MILHKYLADGRSMDRTSLHQPRRLINNIDEAIPFFVELDPIQGMLDGAHE